MRSRVVVASLVVGLAALGAAGSGSAVVVRHGEVKLMEMVTVTGTLRFVDGPDGGRRLEIVSDLGGSYRIAQTDRSAPLRDHVGESVTVVAFVEASPGGGRPLLRVQHFRLYDRQARASSG
jgi:hypothetical protein